MLCLPMMANITQPLLSCFEWIICQTFTDNQRLFNALFGTPASLCLMDGRAAGSGHFSETTIRAGWPFMFGQMLHKHHHKLLLLLLHHTAGHSMLHPCVRVCVCMHTCTRMCLCGVSVFHPPLSLSTCVCVWCLRELIPAPISRLRHVMPP